MKKLPRKVLCVGISAIFLHSVSTLITYKTVLANKRTGKNENIFTTPEDENSCPLYKVFLVFRVFISH